MTPLFPVLIIAIGLSVLALGKRMAVLGAAVGALLGIFLLAFFPGNSGWFITLGVPIALAVIGFFVSGFAKGIVNIVLLVIGALAGALIVLNFLDLFRVSGLLAWILEIAGGVVGLIMVRRYKEWALIILVGLIGGLLVVRGLSAWLPILQGPLGSLLVLFLAACGIVYQGGLLGNRKPETAKS